MFHRIAEALKKWKEEREAKKREEEALSAYFRYGTDPTGEYSKRYPPVDLTPSKEPREIKKGFTVPSFHGNKK